MLGCSRFKRSRDQGTSIDAGIRDGDDSDRSRLTEGLPAFRRGLMMRGQRRANLLGSAGDQDRDFALEVEPGQIVEVAFPECSSRIPQKPAEHPLPEPGPRAC